MVHILERIVIYGEKKQFNPYMLLHILGIIHLDGVIIIIDGIGVDMVMSTEEVEVEVEVEVGVVEEVEVVHN